MSWTLTFGGATVVADTEGVYTDPRCGVVNQTRIYEPLVRGLGVLSKRMGHEGTWHTFSVVFDATEAEVATLRARMTTLAAAGPGTLVIPYYGTFARCVLDAVEEVSCERAWVDLRTIRTGGSAGFALIYRLAFRQLGA